MKKHKKKDVWEETASEEAVVEMPDEEVPQDASEEDAPQAFVTQEQLAALCAELEQLRTALEEVRVLAQVKAVNARNGAQSAGAVHTGGDTGYFSPDEVRAMSREAVRAHYDGIVRSMKHWH